MRPALFVIFVICVCNGLTIDINAQCPDPPGGKELAMVGGVKGTATVRLKNQGEPQTVSKNSLIRKGDCLQVGDGSTVKLLCTTGGVFELETGSYYTTCGGDGWKAELAVGRTTEIIIAPYIKAQIRSRELLKISELKEIDSQVAQITYSGLGDKQTEFLIGSLLASNGLHRETAIRFRQLSDELKASQTDDQLYLAVLDELAFSYRMLKNFDAERQSLVDKLEVVTRLNNTLEVAQTHHDIGKALAAQFQWTKALASYRTAREMYKSLAWLERFEELKTQIDKAEIESRKPAPVRTTQRP